MEKQTTGIYQLRAMILTPLKRSILVPDTNKINAVGLEHQI